MTQCGINQRPDGMSFAVYLSPGTGTASGPQADRGCQNTTIGGWTAALLLGVYRVHGNSGGQWLVSRPLRRLLSRLSTEFPNLHLSIISSDTLFNERERSKFQGIHDLTDSFRISTDAACKETFEKLRRGAKWGTVRRQPRVHRRPQSGRRHQRIRYVVHLSGR